MYLLFHNFLSSSSSPMILSHLPLFPKKQKSTKNKKGIAWPGTEPNASDSLEKIGFKQICDKVGAPTPKFVILATQEDTHQNEKMQVDTSGGVREQIAKEYAKKVLELKAEKPGLIKSIHGGGGKGKKIC